jgi:hypothetical protein
MMNDDNDTTEVVPPQCGFCSTPPTPIQVRRGDLAAWRSGTLIQRAFPEMPADQRELLITGTHPACWDRLFAEDEGDAANE